MIGAGVGFDWIRGKPDGEIGHALGSLCAALVLIVLGYFVLRYRDSDWTLGPRGERVAFGLFALALISGAIATWIFAPRKRSDGSTEVPAKGRPEDLEGNTTSDWFDEIVARRARRDPVDEFMEAVVTNGPAEAAENTIWRALGVGGSAAAMAVVAAIVASGVFWPTIPKKLYAGVQLAKEAINLVGYALLLVLGLALCVVALRNREWGALGAVVLLTAYFGLTIGIGLAFGLFDDLIDIVR